ncbi:hypothetical protein [Haliea sp. E17]|uniref:hypothetical protein n=1 Tax=Haliea sp. E17 TaxID=3401576 RepID=UPI003AAA520E
MITRSFTGVALAVLSLAATTSRADFLSNGDFQSAPLSAGEAYTISSNLDQWITFSSQYTLEAKTADPTDFFAKHRETGGGQDEKLVQFIDASGISGTLALNLDYVYTDSVGAQSNPQGRVSLIGIAADRMYYMYGGRGVDGFPAPPTPDGSGDYGVAPPDSLLAQVQLPFSSSWTPAITLIANVPAGTYDYIGVVVQSGCYEGGGTPDSCETLRGVDNFALYVDEEGPFTKHVMGTPNAAVFGTPFVITAVVDDTERGNSTIKSAEYRILDGGGEVVPWTPMNAADGAFDMSFEEVSANHGGLPIGNYEICVRGTDVVDNTGEESCSNFVTFNPISDSGLNIPISNECAIFYTLENPGAENEVTTLNYGEDIVFDTMFHLNTSLNLSNPENIKFKFHVSANGQGEGVTSGIQYNLLLNSMLKVNLADDFDPFTSDFSLRAKIVGQSQEIDGYGILNGAQNNATLLLKVRIHYEAGVLNLEVFDFSIECQGDPWSNLMENKDKDTGLPVGRGFGDEYNKYGWTGIEAFNSLIVGTKNAYYDLETYVNGDGGGISACYAAPSDFPSIYQRFACMEILGFGNPNVRDSHGAQIWNLSNKDKRWRLAYDAIPRHVPEGNAGEYVQGFRDSALYNGKLYVAADLGAFISGVSYENFSHFPGVALLVSDDGINFEIVPNCPTGNGDLCEAETVALPGLPENNISIRSLAAYGGKLHIGTLNNSGGEHWTFDGTNFAKVYKFPDTVPAVAELEPYAGKLYIGVLGLLTYDDSPNNDYIYVCDDCDAGDHAPLAGLPDVDPDNLGVLKLYASPSMNKLFAGTVNFTNGATLLSYNAVGNVFDVIVDGAPDGGFFDTGNIYMWSMSEQNGRLLVGTFNPSTLPTLPKGSAELWTSDDGVNFFQYPMPLDWSLLGYGIRDIVECDNGKATCLLSATLMPAASLLGIEGSPLRPGLEVWKIREQKITNPSGGTQGSSKGKKK